MKNDKKVLNYLVTLSFIRIEKVLFIKTLNYLLHYYHVFAL